MPTEVVLPLALEEIRIAGFIVALFLYMTRSQSDILPLLYLLIVLLTNSLASFLVVTSIVAGFIIYHELVRFLR